MKHTYTNALKQQLESSGFYITKCNVEQRHNIVDKRTNEVLLSSKWLGVLMKKAEKEFGI